MLVLCIHIEILNTGLRNFPYPRRDGQYNTVLLFLFECILDGSNAHHIGGSFADTVAKAPQSPEHRDIGVVRGVPILQLFPAENRRWPHNAHPNHTLSVLGLGNHDTVAPARTYDVLAFSCESLNVPIGGSIELRYVGEWIFGRDRSDFEGIGEYIRIPLFCGDDWAPFLYV